jgi:hypothetical protein
MTLCNAVFKGLAARWRDTPMMPRSANDKEYFAQDWFAARLDDLRIPYEQQGRNSYPDFFLGEAGVGVEGYELKSLAFTNGRPARHDIDFNSTIPSGLKDGVPIFLLFFLYEGRGDAPRTIHSVSLAHADLINADHKLADEHVNIAIHDFGSYGDGFIRNRKMYVFPHPLSLDPGGIGRCRLIVPAGWPMEPDGLRQAGTISRRIADTAVSSYEIQLYAGAEPSIRREPYDVAGRAIEFSVFELA